MSQLDDLLARSRSPGTLIERRRFTLSRDKAIEKQREFALRDPKQYVLELVQAAVFGGATYIAIDTRPHSLLVAWVGGNALTAKELEDLFDYLFADRGDARWRHLVQLAIGVNAILQRRPRTLRIESGDGESAVRLDLDAAGKGTLGTPTDPIAGTYLYVEYGGGWFSRFRSNTLTDEQALVERRCLYTPVPILLNGSAPFGYRGSRHIEIFGARQQEHFDEEGRRGVVAIHTSPRAPRGFRMVVGGVWISTLALEPLADRALVGVICDDSLRKTADQSDIVQDHRYVHMLHAVQPVATKLMVSEEGPRYRAPSLPPMPELEPEASDAAPKGPAPQPLPEPLPMLWPRGTTTVDDLAGIGDVPLFFVEPTHETSLRGRTAEPDRFPWRVLVLTEGQVLTLAQAVPDASLHRLTSKADVDFVRRVVDRRVRMRELPISGRGYRLVVRLHLEGPLPDWGHGQPGVPFCVVDAKGTVEFGVVDGNRIRVSGTRATTWDPIREVRTALTLPRVSLRLEVDRPDALLEDRHLAAVLTRAWELAVPERGDPHPELLSALLGALAVPQFVRSSEGVTVEASLPVGWPDSLRHVPLVLTSDGDLSLQRFLRLLGTDATASVRDPSALPALDGLESRFGFGHLTHAGLEGQPLFGVGRIADRWVWLENEGMWVDDTLRQMVWVGATFAPRTQDARWRTESHPFPELVSATRADHTPDDWEGGWRLLSQQLHRIEGEGSWARFARGPISTARCEGLGRLAILHLAILLQRAHEPLLVPSDGGGRRSVDEIRTHRAARVVARHGVRLAEPWTFALTRDELAVVQPDPAAGGGPQLRYDDAPEVWRSLSEAEQGWLVRDEVQQSGLRGWLGLRCPHDGTAGILLRTTGQLIALSDIDHSVPCHGLLWPVDGGASISAEQRRIVQLAGLRLYQSLAKVLADRRDPEQTEAARRYAITFVLLSERRSKTLQGTAAELARRVTIHDAEGHPWDTLAVWLETPEHQRPDLDPDLLPIDEELVQETALEAPANAQLQGRLVDALGDPPIAITLARVEGRRHDPVVTINLSRSHNTRAILEINESHPISAGARLGHARFREMLLLEMARQICSWGAPLGLDLDLPRAQLVLLAQRIEG